MKNLKLFLLPIMILFANANASVGIHTGLGIPYVSQYGLNYTMGPSWTLNVQYNNLDLSIGDAKTQLQMPEVGVQWHPFAGAFFIGLGVGQQTLSISASDVASGAKASADVNSTTTVAKLGWMWGKADGGLWFGMDIAFISPSGSEVDIETTNGLGQNTQEYKDVEEAADQFGKTAYSNITFARLGYLF